jgi:hypothetical protein
VDQWSQFNDALVDAACSISDAQVLDATRSIGEVESDVREWIVAKLERLV